MSRDGEDVGQAPRVPALSRGILALVRQSWLAKTPCMGPLTVLPPLALCPIFLGVLEAPFTSILSLLSLLPPMNSLHSAFS